MRSWKTSSSSSSRSSLPPFSSSLCQGSVTLVLLAVGLTGLVTCDCAGGFEEVGIVVNAECSVDQQACLLPDNTFCTPSGDGSAQLTLTGDDGFGGALEVEFDISTGLPDELDPVTPLQFKLTAEAKGLVLQSCAIELKGEACNMHPMRTRGLWGLHF